MDQANRTGDDVFHQSLLGATTNASHDNNDHSRYNSMRKSRLFGWRACCLTIVIAFTDRSFNSGGEGGVFQLPKIGQKSPFKGFLDISIVTQKLRKNMHS